MTLRTIIAAGIAAIGAVAAQGAAPDGFVTVRDGRFELRGEPYRYLGTNLWYAPILASDGAGGDRQRLTHELDSLQSMGIDNLRVLVGGDGATAHAAQIDPNLQTAPGVYNETLLVGLDRLLDELERRDMRAVLYLTNAWEWSGGYGTYLEWTGHGKCPLPNIDGYDTYVNHAAQFVLSPEAREMYDNHVRAIVGRTSSVTGRPYAESPAIMSWQICNEPRSFSRDGKQALADWLKSSARLIKSIDANHLVSTGSEGLVGCEMDLDMWADIHNSPDIDYGTIHIWPYNWRWVKADSLMTGMDQACEWTDEYVTEHRRALPNKPLVLEEFGFPRDNMSYDTGTPVTARDKYYSHVFELLGLPGMIDGANFWGWGGTAVPRDRQWRAGDPWTCDPAHEPQGFYSVFAGDTSTINMIRDAARAIKNRNGNGTE